MQNKSNKLKPYLLFWNTQSLSALGSLMTSYALGLWLYINSGSALKTALLTICSYTPYVAMSIFAGALSDKWNKKRTILISDLFAALTTAAAFLLIKSETLEPWHLYLINCLNGLMNTIQQPASEVVSTQLIPKEYYQKTSGLRSISQSLNTLLTPVLATPLFAFGGISAVIAVDLTTFAAAFIVLLLFIQIPEPKKADTPNESLLSSARAGLSWLRSSALILKLIFFLACINLIASAYESALSPMVISRAAGGKSVFGAVNFCAGAAAFAGSFLASALPAPKNRIRTICLALFVSMSTENFMLAFGRSPVIWCVGALLGWLFIPYMSANMDVIFRNTIPVEMQGRVYACRNTLQFFTIPIGSFAGGALIDGFFTPLMSRQPDNSRLVFLFGSGKGTGAAMFLAVLGFAGVAVCTIFSLLLRKERFNETASDAKHK